MANPTHSKLTKTSAPLCGIDEAGRGPLAGPLVMAGVVLHHPIDGLMDSKKLSEKRRELLYDQIIESAAYHIVTLTANDIDSLGISACLCKGLESIQSALPKCSYLFDGNSTFGALGINTMVKADTKIPEVSAASILAKVARDRMMAALGKEYPQYGFEKHKGYGTQAHMQALGEHGRCTAHRKSFHVACLDDH